MLSNNFKDYLLLPFFMSIPSRRFRLWILRRYHVKIGAGTVVLRNVHFRNGINIEIGKGCVINPNTLLDGRGGKLIIGDNVDIAQESIIWTLGHDPHTHVTKRGDVVIGDYCWIGCRAMIMPGVTIGSSTICAANALVTKDAEPNSIYAGIPAKKISNRNRTKDYNLSFNSKYM